jgi:hypothetical protein
MSGEVEGVAAHARELAHRIIMEFRPNGWQAKEDELYRLLLGRFESLTTPPARSYADGVEDAAKVAAAETGKYPHGNMMYGPSVGPKIAAAIRLLSQGEKA